MSEYKIAVIVGSLRRDSFNRKLAGGLMKLGPPDFSFHDVQIGDLPLYNQDDDASQAPPVNRLKAEIGAANGSLFVTPEYNRSIRPASGSGPDDYQSCVLPPDRRNISHLTSTYPRLVCLQWWPAASM